MTRDEFEAQIKAVIPDAVFIYEILQYKYGGPLYCVEVRWKESTNWSIKGRKPHNYSGPYWDRESTHAGEAEAMEPLIERLVHRRFPPSIFLPKKLSWWGLLKKWWRK